MSLEILIAAETHRLTTLEAILAEIQVDDQIIFAESLIDQASAAIARYLGMPLAQQKYREMGDVPGRFPYLVPSRAPLVRLDLFSLNTVALAPTDYRVESYEAPTLLLRRGTNWPTVWETSWYGHGSSREVVLEYVAGYIVPEQFSPVDPTGPLLPPDLSRACIEACKVWFGERLTTERIVSRSLGDQRIDYGVQALSRGLPMLTRDLLKPYRRVAVA